MTSKEHTFRKSQATHVFSNHDQAQQDLKDGQVGARVGSKGNHLPAPDSTSLEAFGNLKVGGELGGDLAVRVLV